MLAVLLGLLDEAVLEHLRRDLGRLPGVEALAQLVRGHVLLEHAQGRGDLLLVARLDLAVHVVEAPGRLEGGLLAEQHGHGHAGPALDEPVHGLAGADAARQQDAGDVRVGRRLPGGQAADDDVRAVAGGDHEASAFDVVQEIFDLHGGHDDVVDLRAEVLAAVEDFGPDPLHDVGHGGLAEDGHLGDDVQERLGLVQGLLQGDAQSLAVGHVRAVDDDAQDVHGLVGEGLHGQLGGADDLVLGLLAGVGHDQERAAEVGGDVGVDVELEGGAGALEVRALKQDEVALALQLLVLVDDLFDQDGVLPCVDQLLGLTHGQGVGLVVLQAQVELGKDQVDVVILAVRHVVDDGSEEADPADVTQEHLHDAEDNG